MKQSFIASLFVVLCLSGAANSQISKIPTETSSSLASELITSTEVSTTASENLLKLQEENVSKLAASSEQLSQLVNEGLVAKAELEKVEAELAAAKNKVEETQSEIDNSNRIALELKKTENLAKSAKTQSFVKPVLKAINMKGATVMRSTTGNWSLSNLAQVQEFFSASFGRQLPISTLGQSATHNRMRWNHRNAVDVRVHPDSQEGMALMTYLQMSGIPFLAFRGAVPGVSTGPHIHIGFPSHRIT